MTKLETQQIREPSGIARVGVVVLNWNSEETTRCVLRDLGQARDVRLLVYLVDNGSISPEGNALLAEFPDSILVALPKNVGFARGVNAGARRALADGCSHILLLNNDARIEPDRVIPALLAELACDRMIGAAGPLVRNSDGSIQSTGYRYSMWWPIPRPLKGSARDNCAHWYYLSGSCLLIRADALRATGGLDPDYFLYGDDVDFALKLHALGYREQIVHTVSIEHARAASTTLYSKRYAYTALRSNLIVVAKHASLMQRPTAFLACACASLALALLGILHRHFDVPLAAVRAWLDFVAGRWGGFSDAPEILSPPAPTDSLGLDADPVHA